MKTDDLIRALAADPKPRTSLQHLLVGGLLAGAGVATALFLWRVKLRPDFGTMVYQPIFLLKFLVTLSLAAAAIGLAWRLLRPGAGQGPWALALLVAPALLIIGIGYELMLYDPAVWGRRLVGQNSMFCMRMIPFLSVPILLALLFVMRQGAPTRPMFAGAVAGLIAGGLGAALYAAHCTDDSPLFVMTWYGISIALMTAIGAAIGARWLRW
jgi:hypothetical protein